MHRVMHFAVIRKSTNIRSPFRTLPHNITSIPSFRIQSLPQIRNLKQQDKKPHLKDFKTQQEIQILPETSLYKTDFKYLTHFLLQ